MEVQMLENSLYGPQGLFDQVATLQRLLSRSFGSDGAPSAIRSVAAGSFPAMNVGRTSNSIEVYAFAPGLKANSIDVTVERGILRISGEREAPSQVRDAQTQTYAAERPFGKFTRALSLPDDVDTNKVEATYRNGVVRVTIGLQEAAQPKRISVQ
jgi:HSP20 family protein